MRIGGLASGMDTEQIVKDLMRAERMPMDKLTQQKQTLEWQRDSFRELNTMMTKFRDSIFDTVMRSANMGAKKVTSSNESLVTATATAAASNGSFTISKVDQLATAATNASEVKLSVGGVKIDPEIDLYSQKDLFTGGSSFNWKLGEVQTQSFSLTEAQSTVTLEKINFVAEADLIEAMSVKVDGEVYSVITDPAHTLLDNEVFLKMDTGELDFGKELNSGTKINVTYITESTEQNYFTSSIETFNADGESHTETFAFSGEKTLDQVIQNINLSSAGVSMFYDEFSDKVTVMRKETGDFNPGGKEMIFQGGFFTDVLQLDTTTNNEQGGTNAKFTINGLETERTSNTFNISGVTITLNSEFTTSPVNLGISTDDDKVFDTIVNFVKEYNEMLETINGKLTEENYRDFKPLTDEQKEAMSEKDIETWEEKARSGLLRRDQALSSGLDRLRVDIYSPISTSNNNTTIRQLTDLGISTTSNYMDRGKLEINEDKLRAAIENDPEGVFQLFTADGPTSADKGIARRMRESLDVTMRAVSERAGGSHGKLQNHQFTLGRNLEDIETRLSNFERRLKQVEDRYWTQFSAMEKAMQQANSQAESMFSMLMGGNQQQ